MLMESIYPYQEIIISNQNKDENDSIIDTIILYIGLMQDIL